MSDKNNDIVIIPIAVLVVSLIASGILYLLSLAIITLIKSNYSLGWSFFFKTTVVFFVIIFAGYIYDKLKGRI